MKNPFWENNETKKHVPAEKRRKKRLMAKRSRRINRHKKGKRKRK